MVDDNATLKYFYCITTFLPADKNLPVVFTIDEGCACDELALLNDSMSAGVEVVESATEFVVHLGSFEVCKVDIQLWAVCDWAVASAKYVTRKVKVR